MDNAPYDRVPTDHDACRMTIERYPLLVIMGHPAVKKSSGMAYCAYSKEKKMRGPKGRRILCQFRPAYMCNEKARGKNSERVISELSQQWIPRPPIRRIVNAQILSLGAWREESGNLPDASNLYQAVEDWLQGAGILANDRLIRSHDGSDRLPLCNNCPRRRWKPRAREYDDNCGQVKKCNLEQVLIQLTNL